MEAIQVLCMLYNHNLIFREPASSSASELNLEDGDEAGIEAEFEAKENLDWILDLSNESDEEQYLSVTDYKVQTICYHFDNQAHLQSLA